MGKLAISSQKVVSSETTLFPAIEVQLRKARQSPRTQEGAME